MKGRGNSLLLKTNLNNIKEGHKVLKVLSNVQIPNVGLVFVSDNIAHKG